MAPLGEVAGVFVLTGLLAVGALLVMALRKPNFAWLILVGAVVGVAYTARVSAMFRSKMHVQCNSK